MTLRPLALLLCAALLASCGFHLRGSSSGVQASVYIESNNARQLGEEVRLRLSGTKITVVDSAKAAEYILKLSSEHQERKVLSVSAQTGKVVEVELIYSAEMSVTSADGKELDKNQLMTARRDLSYDERVVIDKFEEERLLQDELRQRVATNILSRLYAILR